MTDRQIIESKIALSQSCLSKQREDVYDLLVKYRGALVSELKLVQSMTMKYI